jgi:hypothetical protein
MAFYHFFSDGTGRTYYADLVRNGETVEIRGLYRKQSRVPNCTQPGMTRYRESCHGKLPTIAKLALFDAVSACMGDSAS